MLNRDHIFRVVVTGPESTGKTELAGTLARMYGTVWIPEYARHYIEKLGRPYNYEDVICIARHQLLQEQEYALKAGNGILIFDTWLILTKVWLDLVFGKCPEWITDHIRTARIDLFLVCNTDLPWIEDPVRENGGEMREKLFNVYCSEIDSFNFKYEIISGTGPARAENAVRALSKHGLKL